MVSQTDFDVAIAGGGPAGATVALCLSRLGRRVALFEAGDFAGPRYGETFPPEINPLLRRLNLWDGFLTVPRLESPGILSVWGGEVPHEQDFINNVHGCGWHVDRARFDEMLWRRAGAEGAHLFLGGRADSASARFHVDATGRSAMREVEDSLVVVAVHLDHRSPDLRTMVESVPDGWWYSAPLPNGEIIAMFFTDRETYSEGFALGAELEQAHLTRARIGAAAIRQSKVLHAVSGIRKEIIAPNWLAVGDSAACHDPVSGYGVFEAIRRGEEAAKAIHAALDVEASLLDAYAESVRSSFAEYRRKRCEVYASESRWSARGFWSRRVVKSRRAP